MITLEKIINLLAAIIWAAIGHKCMMDNWNVDCGGAAIFFTLMCFLLCSIFFNNYQTAVQKELEQLIKREREKSK